MDAAYVFLAVTGLLYPEHLLETPAYAQFTALPSAVFWPHREDADAQGTYHLYPTSPLENPLAIQSPFGTGADPSSVLPSAAGDQFDGTLVSLALWRQIAAGEQDSENRDLDADRRMAHSCWAAKGSVHDDPIDVVTLQYKDQ